MIDTYIHRLNIVFWSPILLVFLSLMFMLGAPFMAGELLWRKIKEYWR